MADTIANLEIMLGLQGLATVTGGLREVSGALGTTAEAASTLNRAQLAGGLLASGAALTGIGVGIGKVAEAGISFQDMLITTQNNTTMTTADIAALSAGVLQLARDAGVGTDVLATGFMKAMNISGDAAAAMAILRVATESATSTGGNAAATTNVLANAMHEYGLDVVRAKDGTLDLAAVQANAAHVMGVMHLAAAEGNMTLEQFSDYSGRAIGIAANLGVSLSDVSAAFTSLTKHGFDAAGAQVQVVDLMTHLINPSKATQKELNAITKQTGIDLRGDFSAEGLKSKGLVGVINDVRAAFRLMGYDEAAATEEAMKLVNAQRGGLGLASLIGTGAGDYASILADLNDQTKTTTVTDEAFARTQATVANQFARLRETVITTADSIGMAMLPRLGQLLGFVTPLVDRLAGWMRAHADLVGPLLATVGGVVALVGAAATLGGTLLFASLGLGALGGILGPVLLVAGAIGTLGLAFRSNFGGLRDLVTGLASIAGPTLRALFEAFRTGDFNAAFGAIITGIDDVFGADVAGNLTLGISGALRVAQLARDGFLTFREALAGDWFGGNTESINVWVRTIGRVGTALHDLASTFDRGGWVAVFGSLWEAVRPGLTQLWDGLTGWIGTQGPLLVAQLWTWGTAFAGWAADLWATRIWPGLVTVFGLLSDWLVAQTPTIVEHLASWAAAFGEWAGNIWETNIHPRLTELWNRFTAWWANPGGVPQSGLAQGVLGMMNDVTPQGTGDGFSFFLDHLNASITLWGATTGHDTMMAALRALFVGKGGADNDFGFAANVLNSFNVSIDTWAATTGHTAIVNAFHALGDGAAQGFRDAFFAGLPDWLKKRLNVDTGSIVGADGNGGSFGGVAPTPGGGSGMGGAAGGVGSGGGGQGFTPFALNLGNQGGGAPITLVVNYNSPLTAADVARAHAAALYDELASLLGASGGGGAAPSAGTVY